MTVLERLANAVIVPVAVIEQAEDALPTAKAMLAGGIDVMEITFRTSAAADAIASVSQNCPEMLVGAGTVIHLEQCKLAVKMGAKFIVSPGLNPEVVAWCTENHIPVVPGCITPTEITTALTMGLSLVKFFPANIFGGLNAMKNLAAVFGGVKFIPTGGIHTDNLKEYIRAPWVHAVGGSWVCPKDKISSHDFDEITRLCAEARQAAEG